MAKSEDGRELTFEELARNLLLNAKLGHPLMSPGVREFIIEACKRLGIAEDPPKSSIGPEGTGTDG